MITLHPLRSPDAENCARLDSSSISPALREVGRTLTTIRGSLMIAESGAPMIILDRSALDLDERTAEINGKIFEPKSETHVTLFNFKGAGEIKKLLRDPERAAALQAMIDGINRSGGIELTLDRGAPVFHLAKDVTNMQPGGIPFVEHRESIVAPLESSGVKDLFDRMTAILGRPLTEPFLHVTLYTHGSPHGIAIPDSTALNQLMCGEIARGNFDGFLSEKPSPAKDLRTQIDQFLSAAERVSGAAPTDASDTTAVSPKECGKEILRALATPQPVAALAQSLERPHIAAALKDILDLRHIEQEPRHHPEGNVLIHTLMVVDAAAALSAELKLSPVDRSMAVMGALLHDIGKGAPGITKRKPDGQGGSVITAYGHEGAGVEPACELLKALQLDAIAEGVLAVVRHHMAVPARCREVDRGNMTLPRCIERTREMLDRECRFFNPEVLMVCTVADWRGRGTPETSPQREAFIAKITAVFQEALTPRPPNSTTDSPR